MQPKTLRAIQVCCVLIAFATAHDSAYGQGHVMSGSRPTMYSTKQMQLSQAMRKLWEDHVTWTRLYIVSAASDLRDLPATQQRLLRNQSDIGNAVKPYYGQAAGDKLTKLLKEHIVLAAQVVMAAKNGKDADLVSANKKWYANADQIADFLSSANPKNWNQSAMRSHMRGHLKLTAEEAVAQLKGDWTGSVAAYDKVHIQILQMADILTHGLIQQFPNRFK